MYNIGMKRENIKNKLIVILGGLLFISIVANVLLGQNFRYNQGSINELNKAAKLDFDYVNKQNDSYSLQYYSWKSCSIILAGVLQNELSDAEIKSKFDDYLVLLDDTKKSYEELQTLKTQRSEEIAKFKYVNIYKN